MIKKATMKHTTNWQHRNWECVSF